MVKVNLELFEALKKTLNEDAARMIAEVVPQAEDLATRQDVDRVERRIDLVEFRLGQRIDRLESKLLRWTLSFFAPMWVAVLATLVALVWRS